MLHAAALWLSSMLVLGQGKESGKVVFDNVGPNFETFISGFISFKVKIMFKIKSSPH